MAVKKIAVLGGGMGSLTAVYKLTSEPDWKSKYDITVYQMGWRLGGKGASGRNGSIINGLSSQRIEEHGLHLWFGFYDNAFRLIQQCYADNNRQPGTPLATWQEAFEGYTTICMEENINGQWLHWPFNVPPNSLTPGQGDAPPRPHDYIHKILDFMKAQHEAYQGKKSPEAITNIQAHAQSEHMGLIKTLLADIVGETAHLFADAGLFLLHAAIELAKISEHTLLIQILEKLKEWLVIIIDGLMTKDTELRRIFIILDLGIVTIKGMIHDKVIKEGFDVINNYDYRDWLVKHGADNLTVNSAIVQGVYGLVFGGNRQYTFEAGTALRGLLRLGLTFKGHVYYRMLAGMGDVIFGPMYQVLQARGVNFQFFHKVSNIGLSPDQSSIASVSFDVQATLKSNYSVYNPLVTVQNLPCWPSTPNYEYLNEGEALQSQQVNLESYYSTWKPVQQVTKYINTDFDEIILGISIGALPTIAKELSNNTPQGVKWQQMIANVIPISTVAYQLWLKSSIEQMQYPYRNDGLALLGSYQEPFDTWADMSDLITRENWPEGYVPQNIAYFCGPTPAPYANQILQNAQTGNFGDPTFPQQQTQVAQNYALEYLQKLSQHIWPGLWQNGQTTFDFSQLIDLNNGEGQARFNAQFFRSNIDPTELYVMSLTNSTSFRIKTNETGYNGLYITGDWIFNGFNAGCIEATVMSGMQAANAVAGLPLDIPGENENL